MSSASAAEDFPAPRDLRLSGFGGPGQAGPNMMLPDFIAAQSVEVSPQEGPKVHCHPEPVAEGCLLEAPTDPYRHPLPGAV